MNDQETPAGKARLLTVTVPAVHLRAAQQYLCTGPTPCSLVSESTSGKYAVLTVLSDAPVTKARDPLKERLAMLRAYVDQYSARPVAAIIHPVNII